MWAWTNLQTCPEARWSGGGGPEVVQCTTRSCLPSLWQHMGLGGQSAASREGAQGLDPRSCPGMGSKFQPKARATAPFQVRLPGRQKSFQTTQPSFSPPGKRKENPGAINPCMPRHLPGGCQGERSLVWGNGRGEGTGELGSLASGERRPGTDLGKPKPTDPLRGASRSQMMRSHRSPMGAQAHFPV